MSTPQPVRGRTSRGRAKHPAGSLRVMGSALATGHGRRRRGFPAHRRRRPSACPLSPASTAKTGRPASRLLKDSSLENVVVFRERGGRYGDRETCSTSGQLTSRRAHSAILSGSTRRFEVTQSTLNDGYRACFLAVYGLGMWSLRHRISHRLCCQACGGER